MHLVDRPMSLLVRGSGLQILVRISMVQECVRDRISNLVMSSECYCQ
jgi:hypothetical protein